MNKANKITLIRVILIPVIMIVYAINPLRDTLFFGRMSVANFIILILALICFATDFFDGYVARKYNLTTDLGKFLDALADKLLVTVLMLILCDESRMYGCHNLWDRPVNLLPWWVFGIVLARDLVVNGIRLIAASKKRVIAANIFGKIKTNLQYITIAYLLFIIYTPEKYNTETSIVNYYRFGGLEIIAYVLVGLMVLATILSGIIYVIQNKDVLKEKKKN